MVEGCKYWSILHKYFRYLRRADQQEVGVNTQPEAICVSLPSVYDVIYKVLFFNIWQFISSLIIIYSWHFMSIIKVCLLVFSCRYGLSRGL